MSALKEPKRPSESRTQLKSDYNKSATIHDLPVEIMDYIFSFLNLKERFQTELVCRRWRDISQTVKWSWPTEIDLKKIKRGYFKGEDVTDDILSPLLLRCGTNLKKLSIADPDYLLAGKVFHIVGKNCPNIVEMKLSRLHMKNIYSLLIPAKRCKKLKKVLIGDSRHLNDDLFKQFLRHCCSLEYLGLGGNESITEESLKDVNRNLKGFYIYIPSYCDNLLVKNFAEVLMNRCECIEEFGVFGYASMPGHTLLKLLHQYKNLRVLYLHFLYGCKLSKLDCYTIPNMLQLLDEVSLHNIESVDDNFVRLLAEKCRKLKKLTIWDTRVTDVGISALASAPSLKVLDVSGSLYISGDGIQCLAKQGRLEELYASDIVCDEQFFEAQCVSLANFCPNLRVLDLSYCLPVTDVLVAAFDSSLERGFLKETLSLFVKGTQVSYDISYETCDKLKLSFKACPWNFDLPEIWF